MIYLSGVGVHIAINEINQKVSRTNEWVPVEYSNMDWVMNGSECL